MVEQFRASKEVTMKRQRMDRQVHPQTVDRREQRARTTGEEAGTNETMKRYVRVGLLAVVVVGAWLLAFAMSLTSARSEEAETLEHPQTAPVASWTAR
ncbi:MAG: hypothetical protein AVDCRST_MAG25-2074 [uncultured Rubrobacteraceae bacterium]|uniref:Uncharacterized protein n=1 Tax=uncultured Rubrobacteraceae bacterium TaxID=349277 RepID=A0A6J4RFN6_9ACTN|nr:MAG: hypothetical protein AVDCRST_MAG25-2074 [uncultured Rubrobacteraceae bacterium]